MKGFFYMLLIICIPVLGMGQVFTPKVKTYTREGNRSYKAGSFVDAEVSYKKALEEEAADFKARFNLGNSLYAQERYDDAIKEYQQAAGLGEDKLSQSLAYYNLGNSFLNKKDYRKAANAFKDALKRNPSDMDTRYNLAYALEQLKNNSDQNKDDDKKDPSEFAKKLKAQADELVKEKKYQAAFDLMQSGLKKDETVSYYNDFIGRLKEVSGVDESNK
ncbi:MAG: tetratricopeptide repeat protein [Bacteroidia bacterium]|nr:tetratricopeptide repeat protein [Bacteroidia bacterium]